MSADAHASEPAIPTAEEPKPKKAPKPPKPPKKPKGQRRISMGDWVVAKRVLAYAHPFRAQIVVALLVGMMASFLTAANMAAMIPVLTIIFEETDQSRAESVRRDLAEAEERLAKASGFFEEWGAQIEVWKQEADLEWKQWLVDKQEDAVYIMAGILVVAQIVKCLLEYISKFMLAKSFYLAISRLRTDLYERCINLDLPQFQKITSGDLISRLNVDIRNVRTVFSTMVGEIVLVPFTVLALLALLFILNWKLTLIVFVGMPLIVVPISLLGRALRTMGRKDEEEDTKLLSVVQETIQGLQIVKTFASEKRELNRFHDMARMQAAKQIRREGIRLYGDPVVEVLASIAMAGVLCLGAYIVLKSDSAGMGPVAFFVYLGILTRFYPPIKRLTGAFIKLQKGLANAERIFNVIDTKPVIVEKPDAVDMPSFEKEIRFENVVFSYSADRKPALEDFSLTIEKGKKVALIGKAGAGKSTVIRLLPRLYDVTDGRITIDGLDIRDMKIKSLRKQMAVVTQDPILFNDSIFNNIRYARPDATKEEVIAAARAAYADEFIEELPKKYDTVIGERGGQLSGGQRQRVTIARALLANSPILILDEATSALDNVSESIVQKAIDALMQDRTVIVIAHRLSTIRKADEIVVLGEGKIIERGTHEELLEKEGAYYTMLKRPELAGVS